MFLSGFFFFLGGHQDPEVHLVPHEQLERLEADASLEGQSATYGDGRGTDHIDRFLPTSPFSIAVEQVYFTWVIRDFGSAEWFHSLLHAIEEQDTRNRIEINIYLTARIKEDDMNNIIVRVLIRSLVAHRAIGEIVDPVLLFCLCGSCCLYRSRCVPFVDDRSKTSVPRRTRSRRCVRPRTSDDRTGTACSARSRRSTLRRTSAWYVPRSPFII